MNHGNLIRARFDTALQRWSGRPANPVEVRVVVTLGEVTDDALPTADEEALLAPFEELVAVLSRVHAVRAGTITSDGLRVYVHYSPTAEWLGPFRLALRQRLPTRHVEVTAGIDPPWTLYRAFVNDASQDGPR